MHLSIEDVQAILQEYIIYIYIYIYIKISDPINLIDKDEVIKLSRYLVEDNNEDFLIYDINNSNNVEIIRSIFKNLIG